MVTIVNSGNVAFIDLRNVPEQNYHFTHGAWYESPWVSTDVMVTLLAVDMTPEDRALVPSMRNQIRVWSFPDDYVERLKANLLGREPRRSPSTGDR